MHWTGHFLFHEQGRLFRHREIGQHAHRTDHLAEGKHEHQRDVPCINS